MPSKPEPPEEGSDPIATAFTLAWLYKQHPDTFLGMTFDWLNTHAVHTERLFGRLKDVQGRMRDSHGGAA